MKKYFLLLLLTAMALVVNTTAQSTVDTVLTNGLADPRGVALLGDNIYITDSGSHRVLKYAPDTGLLTTLAGVTGRTGTNNGPGFVARFFSPKGIVPALGGLVVADSDNHQIRFINISGSVALVTNLAGIAGSLGFTAGAISSDGVPAAAAQFNTPIGLAADASGNIYIADSKNNAIRMLTQIGGVPRVLTIATNLLEPVAVAVGEQTGSVIDIYVADTRNHAIKLFGFDIATRLMTTNRLSAQQITPVIIAGNAARIAGTNDSLFGEEALFNLPSALLWSGTNVGLIVSDTGNHTLRRIYKDPLFQDPIFQDPNILQFFDHADLTNRFSTETYAGQPNAPGFRDGPVKTVQFNSPSVLVRNSDGDLLVVDSGNNALRRVQITPRLPRVKNPVIGWVDFVLDETTGERVSSLVPVTDGIFHNDVIIAILPEEGAQSFYNAGVTPGLFDKDTIASPNKTNSLPSPPYRNGLSPAAVPPTILEPAPDITIKAINTAERRSPSEVTQARFRFQVAPPVISGINPAAFTLKSETEGADIYYTLDDTTPTNQTPASILYPQSPPIPLPITNAVTLRARAFKRGYRPSEVSAKIFQPEDFRPNQMTFGFEAGEASSQFLGSAGQTFIAPVTLSLLPAQTIYSMQFNLTITNRSGGAPVSPGAYTFHSMLLETLPDGSVRTIDPKMFERNNIQVITNIVPNGILVTTNFIEVFRDLLFTNSTQNLLGVGWFEVVGQTNLYNTVAQNLVTFSHAHDRRFLSSAGKVVVGGYSFRIPVSAANGSAYRIQAGRPSAIEDAFSRNVFIDAPTNGSLGGGAISAIKDVTIVPGGTGAGQLYYIVGDVSPFRWYNAGDFGDTNIFNSDVFQVFQAGTYGFNVPPSGTDFFDAMDSCCITTAGASLTNVFDGSVANLDQITFGDGTLNVTDVFVTFRRSLDPSLKWFARYWVNGQRQVAAVPNLFRGKLNTLNKTAPTPQANLPAETLGSNSSSQPAQKPSVNFSADDLRAIPGQTINVPIRAEIAGNYPVRLLMLNLTVEPLDGTPPLKEPVQFIPAATLGKPALTTATGSGNYAAAWLDDQVAGLKGSALVGNLRVTIPAQANASASYRIHFDHASASPNGLGLLPQQLRDGLVTGSDRSASSFGDGLPDHWRLRYFGSVLNYLSQADADADGDGLTNLAEYKAGTNPNDVTSQLRLLTGERSAIAGASSKALSLRWPSVRNKIYAIETASRLSGAEWIMVTNNLVGTGGEMEFSISKILEGAQFYRVRLVE
jgi:hypothetical protein